MNLNQCINIRSRNCLRKCLAVQEQLADKLDESYLQQINAEARPEFERCLRQTLSKYQNIQRHVQLIFASADKEELFQELMTLWMEAYLYMLKNVTLKELDISTHRAVGNLTPIERAFRRLVEDTSPLYTSITRTSSHSRRGHGHRSTRNTSGHFNQPSSTRPMMNNSIPALPASSSDQQPSASLAGNAEIPCNSENSSHLAASNSQSLKDFITNTMKELKLNKSNQDFASRSASLMNRINQLRISNQETPSTCASLIDRIDQLRISNEETPLTSASLINGVSQLISCNQETPSASTSLINRIDQLRIRNQENFSTCAMTASVRAIAQLPEDPFLHLPERDASNILQNFPPRRQSMAGNLDCSALLERTRERLRAQEQSRYRNNRNLSLLLRSREARLSQEQSRTSRTARFMANRNLSTSCTSQHQVKSNKLNLFSKHSDYVCISMISWCILQWFSLFSDVHFENFTIQ